MLHELDFLPAEVAEKFQYGSRMLLEILEEPGSFHLIEIAFDDGSQSESMRESGQCPGNAEYTSGPHKVEEGLSIRQHARHLYQASSQNIRVAHLVALAGDRGAAPVRVTCGKLAK